MDIDIITFGNEIQDLVIQNYEKIEVLRGYCESKECENIPASIVESMLAEILEKQKLIVNKLDTDTTNLQCKLHKLIK